MDSLSTAGTAKLDIFLNWLNNPTTMLVFLPLLGCLLIMATPAGRRGLIRFWALLTSGLSMVVAVLMVTGLPESLRGIPTFAQYLPFQPDFNGLQFAQTITWLQIHFGEYHSFGVNYEVGVDGLSLPLLIMSSVVIFLAVLWSMGRTERVRDYFALLLLMETGLLGVFVAMDYVLFYLFWELMLVPMYFLIAAWGPRREQAGKAAIKFFIYTMFGSVFMLIAFIAMQVLSGGYDFSVPRMMEYFLVEGMAVRYEWRLLMFIGLLLGFAVKVPMFPFHTWLPDAHTEAPTEMSVVLAAVMLKTGSYAYLRMLYPTFPDIAYVMGPIIAFCGLMAIVYGAAVTLVQTDLKRLVAYSSISHMGFVVLGISAMNQDATIGAIYQMVAHGVIIATLFFLCGVVERRYGTRDIRELGGMLAGAPAYAITLGLAAFAGMGLPGLAGFWGEFLTLKGTFFNNVNWTTVHVGPLDGSRYLQVVAVVAVAGILTSAVYMINMLQKVVLGRERAQLQPWRGFAFREGVVLTVLALGIIALGLYPTPVIRSCQFWTSLMAEVAMNF